jgi:hypothetical protein
MQEERPNHRGYFASRGLHTWRFVPHRAGGVMARQARAAL